MSRSPSRWDSRRARRLRVGVGLLAGCAVLAGCVSVRPLAEAGHAWGLERGNAKAAILETYLNTV